MRYLQVNGKIDCDTFKYESGLDSVIQQVSTHINANDSTFPIVEKLEPRWFCDTRKDRRHYREVIHPSLRAYIEKQYKEDLETFGYEW